MVQMKQAIVVEGRYDKNALSQIVSAPAIFQTDGYTSMHDPRLLALLRQAAETTGLVILTDSDAAGFLIRNTLKSQLPVCGVLHAYIPQIEGKEKRKKEHSKEGLLGVEGVGKEAILQALRDAGAELDGKAESRHGRITKQDLYSVGLSGKPDSSARRKNLMQELDLPRHMSANALLQALNILFTRELFLARYSTQEDES